MKDDRKTSHTNPVFDLENGRLLYNRNHSADNVNEHSLSCFSAQAQTEIDAESRQKLLSHTKMLSKRMTFYRKVKK
jgi:hypothetical protein